MSKNIKDVFWCCCFHLLCYSIDVDDCDDDVDDDDGQELG